MRLTSSFLYICLSYTIRRSNASFCSLSRYDSGAFGIKAGTFQRSRKIISQTSRINRNSVLNLSVQTDQSTSENIKNTEDNNNGFPKGNIILFDGVCNFCNTWVDILLRVDVNKQFRFAPLQSDIGQKLLVAIGKEADDISSVLLIKENLEYFDKSGCVLKVVEELGPLAGVFSKAAETVVPLSIRDSIYDTVAENRYNFMGKRDQCRSGDPKYFDRFVS